jgi:hypothetical protein
MWTSLTTAYITQYAVRKTPATSTDQFTLTNGNSTNTFNYGYYYSGGNVPTMIAAAEREKSPYYIGAGKIILAMDLAHATDMLGDIPYSEAFLGAENYTPKYDPQEQIYANIISLLNEGITLMKTPAAENSRPLYLSVPSPSGDILYKGDVTKWIKLANSLKARQLNHLTKKTGIYDPKQVLQFVTDGFSSSQDDAQLQYIVAVAPQTGTTNIFGVTRSNFSTATFSNNIIKYLNGSVTGAAFPGVTDPRLPIMVAGSSSGADPGVSIPATSNVLNNVADFYNGWYARDLGIFEVITFHELKFIEAEAAYLAGDKTRALKAYKAGIGAHMTKIGVGGTFANPNVTFPTITPAQIEAYLSSSAVAQTEAQLTIKNIMEQKYIAMFLNPESWSDLRRYDFSPDIYPNLKYPVGAPKALNNQWPRRMLPGATEVMYNPQAVAALGASAPDYITKPLWWDMP